MNQPAPIKNDFPIIHELLIDLIRQRLDFGIKKYGVALQPFNRRRSLIDALDEAMDLSVYLLQEIEERKAIDSVVTAARELSKQTCQLHNDNFAVVTVPLEFLERLDAALDGMDSKKVEGY